MDVTYKQVMLTSEGQGAGEMLKGPAPLVQDPGYLPNTPHHRTQNPLQACVGTFTNEVYTHTDTFT